MSTPDQTGPRIAPDDDARVFDPSLIAEAPGWPKVIGVLSLILAILGILGGSCGLLSPAFTSYMMNSLPPDQQAKMAQAPMSALTFPLLGFGLLLAIFLIIAAVATLQRKAAGRTLHLVWAGGIWLSVVVGMVDAFRHAPVVAEWAKSQPKENVGAAMFRDASSFLAVAFVFSALRILWPSFILIWFGLVKRNPRQMIDANA